ncbi:MAG TPA: Ig-like domain-containing protein [Ohtaekwangia sp.]|nr:Ig-like domain-containing protein [Ohtaekwangia sp.]
MRSLIFQLKPALWNAAILLSFMFLQACDAVDPDVTPGGPQVDVVDTEIVILSNGSAYIDLFSKIKTQHDVRLDITSQPQKGSLTELGTGFLRYSPGQHFVRGRDAFGFSIYDKNNLLLKRDSLVIIVEDDSTNLPCAMYPQDDYIYNVSGGSVLVNVLANDIICGDTANLVVSIYQPGSGFPPHHGTATVLTGGLIQYTPGNSFNGSDELIYRISVPGDTSAVGFAMVRILPKAQCNFYLNPDDYTFSRDTLTHDTVQLYVLNNDILCDSTGQNHFSIIEQPQHGTAFYSSASPIGYILPDAPAAFTDSLVYRVCIDQQCKIGRVRIKVD